MSGILECVAEVDVLAMVYEHVRFVALLFT